MIEQVKKIIADGPGVPRNAVGLIFLKGGKRMLHRVQRIQYILFEASEKNGTVDDGNQGDEEGNPEPDGQIAHGEIIGENNQHPEGLTLLFPEKEVLCLLQLFKRKLRFLPGTVRKNFENLPFIPGGVYSSVVINAGIACARVPVQQR